MLFAVLIPMIYSYPIGIPFPIPIRFSAKGPLVVLLLIKHVLGVGGYYRHLTVGTLGDRFSACIADRQVVARLQSNRAIVLLALHALLGIF